MYEPYYIDRDPRPKTKPCPHCARDVEVAGRGCLCVPSQPRHVPVTLSVPAVYRPEDYEQATARSNRCTLRFLNEEPDL